MSGPYRGYDDQGYGPPPGSMYPGAGRVPGAREPPVYPGPMPGPGMYGGGRPGEYPPPGMGPRTPYGRPPYQGPPFPPGGGVSPSEMAAMSRGYGGYAGGPQGTSPEQRAAAFYGHMGPGGPPNADYGYAYAARPDAMYQRPPPPDYGPMPPLGGHPAAYGIPPKLSPNSNSSPPKSSPSAKSPSAQSAAHSTGSASSKGRKGRSEDDDDDDDYKDGKEFAKDENESPRGDKDEDNENDEDDEDGQKWFSGAVPLGLEDDKYWLSELQVYLRSNFAEAFGATEEDIAAPMHGRNKPIAFGQVGIRCMHCQCKFSIVALEVLEICITITHKLLTVPFSSLFFSFFFFAQMKIPLNVVSKPLHIRV